MQMKRVNTTNSCPLGWGRLLTIYAHDLSLQACPEAFNQPTAQPSNWMLGHQSKLGGSGAPVGLILEVDQGPERYQPLLSNAAGIRIGGHMVALVSVVSVIVGAFLQYIFTRHLENQRHHRERRAQAYADYLRAVCDQAQLGNQLHPEAHEVYARTADAKCRICLYGPANIVQAFADFERLGATMKTPEQMGTFTKMVAAMRSDSGGVGTPTMQSLQLVLLGKDPGA
jgi:hypothetical protein